MAMGQNRTLLGYAGIAFFGGMKRDTPHMATNPLLGGRSVHFVCVCVFFKDHMFGFCIF